MGVKKSPVSMHTFIFSELSQVQEELLTTSGLENRSLLSNKVVHPGFWEWRKSVNLLDRTNAFESPLMASFTC
jgi:hypothetical protein